MKTISPFDCGQTAAGVFNSVAGVAGEPSYGGDLDDFIPRSILLPAAGYNMSKESFYKGLGYAVLPNWVASRISAKLRVAIPWLMAYPTAGLPTAKMLNDLDRWITLNQPDILRGIASLSRLKRPIWPLSDEQQVYLYQNRYRSSN